MAKVRFYEVEKKERIRMIEELYEAIAGLGTKDEVFRFLFGLFTPSEVLMIARRIQITKMLIDGATFDSIGKRLKVSHQTINKIEHWLKSDEERMRFINQKLTKIKDKAGKDKGKGGNRNRETILDRYPSHKFLKDLLSR